MADQSLSPELIQALNFLGHNVSIPITGSQSLPGAAAAGAVPAPSTTSTTGGSAGGGGGLGLTGGGLIPQGPDAGNLLNSGVGLARLASNLFGGGQTPTRGDTGGVSLSDQLRSAGNVGDIGAAASTIAAPPASFGPGAAAAGADLTGVPTSGTSFFGPAFGEIGAQGFGPGGAATAPEVASLGGEAASLGGGAGAEAATDAALAAGSASTAGLGALGGLFLPFIISGIEGMLGMDPGPSSTAAKLQDTGHVRQNFAQGWPIMSEAPKTLAALQNPNLSQAQLQDILRTAGNELNQGPGISQFISTEGGKQKGLVAPIDVSGVSKFSGGLSNDALLASLIANDRLRQGGQPEQAEGTGPFTLPPLDVISRLAESAGIPASSFYSTPGNERTGMIPDTGQFYDVPAVNQVSPEQLAAFTTPGQTIPTLQAIMSAINPNFASSPLGQMLAPFLPQPQAAASPAQGAVNALPAVSGAGALGAVGGEDERLRQLLGVGA